MADSILRRTLYDAAMRLPLTLLALTACGTTTPDDGNGGGDIDASVAGEVDAAGDEADAAGDVDARHDDPDGTFAAAGGWAIRFDADCGEAIVRWWMNYGGADAWWDSSVDVTVPDGFRPAMNGSDAGGCRLWLYADATGYEITCGRWDGADPRLFVEVSDDGETATAHVRRWGHDGCRADDVDATVTSRER